MAKTPETPSLTTNPDESINFTAPPVQKQVNLSGVLTPGRFTIGEVKTRETITMEGKPDIEVVNY